MGSKGLGPIEQEFDGAELGDERRNRRLAQIGRAISKKPAAGFPQVMGGNAALEAFYRFINNDSFEAEEILQPHVEATIERALEEDEVLVIHDTTHVDLPGDPRSGMGFTTQGRSGFLSHFSIVTSLQGKPLGSLGFETWTRSGKKWQARKGRSSVDSSDPERESKRWISSVLNAEEEFGAREVGRIHLADSEGDFFEFLSAMREAGARYVVRAAQLGRLVESERGREALKDVVGRLRPTAHREVELSERKPSRRDRGGRIGSKRHAPRKARSAKLAIASTRVGIRKTRYVRGAGTAFEINVVRVWEPNPPRGQEGVEWILLTTEPVGTKKQQHKIVDLYRRRWQIEEFFKALKTGCALQKRQVESLTAMRKVLALLTPLAHRILYLKGLHRGHPNDRAEEAFDETDLYLLANGQEPPVDVPDTIDGAMLLLARFGGHISNNGPPGWITLGQGYEKLLLLRMGWELARRKM